MDIHVESSVGSPQPIEHRQPIAGTDTFWYEMPPVGDVPTLYVHGVPENADAWLEFLPRTGGAALDLVGFGRSEKPRFFEYSMGAYNAYLQAFIGQLGWDRFNLVTHDWGGMALVTAQELYERVNRLVIVNSVPLLPGYRWHRIARGWRTPILGELMMGLTTKSVAKFFSKESRPNREPWPQQMLDANWRYFDQGTQRAILKLYRSAPETILEQAGERLSLIKAPTLVVWGEQDPYLPTEFAQAYASAVPNGNATVIADAGHWPWIDKPETTDMIVDFLLERDALN